MFKVVALLTVLALVFPPLWAVYGIGFFLWGIAQEDQ
jgi:hypothetical protein